MVARPHPLRPRLSPPGRGASGAVHGWLRSERSGPRVVEERAERVSRNHGRTRAVSRCVQRVSDPGKCRRLLVVSSVWSWGGSTDDGWAGCGRCPGREPCPAGGGGGDRVRVGGALGGPARRAHPDDGRRFWCGAGVAGHGAGASLWRGRDAVGGGVRGGGAGLPDRAGSGGGGHVDRGCVGCAAPVAGALDCGDVGAGAGVAGAAGGGADPGGGAVAGAGPVGRRADRAVSGVVAVGAVPEAGGGEDRRGRPRGRGGAADRGGVGAVRRDRAV